MKFTEIINKNICQTYNDVEKIIKLIDNDDWDQCKTIWAWPVNKSTPNDIGQFCYFSTERSVFTTFKLSKTFIFLLIMQLGYFQHRCRFCSNK